jgi:hypothetical protein
MARMDSEPRRAKKEIPIAKNNEQQDEMIGVKWGWYAFLFLLFITLASLVGKLFGIQTGYRWWWWLITVFLPFIFGGIIGLLQRETKNSKLRYERIFSPIDFKKLSKKKEDEIRSGNFTIGLGCLMGLRTKTEFQAPLRTEYKVEKHIVSPLTFDTSSKIDEKKYMISMPCPTCKREINFCVIRNDVKPKVLLPKEKYSQYDHKIYGWPMLLDKLHKNIKGIKASGLIICFIGFLITILPIALAVDHPFFVIPFSVLFIIMGIYIIKSSFNLALKRYEYSEKSLDDFWKSSSGFRP